MTRTPVPAVYPCTSSISKNEVAPRHGLDNSTARTESGTLGVQHICKRSGEVRQTGRASTMPRKRAPRWKPSYRGNHHTYGLKLPRRRGGFKIKLPRLPRIRIKTTRRRRIPKLRMPRTPRSRTVYVAMPLPPAPPVAPVVQGNRQPPKGQWSRPLAFIPDPPAGVQPDPLRVWWVVDPRDRQGCCEDCRAAAAASPYVPPWVRGGNQLEMTPGDGRCRCGAGCTCHLSYMPPEWIYWPPIEQLSAADRKRLETPWDVQADEYP